jgi:hypothetical protein
MPSTPGLAAISGRYGASVKAAIAAGKSYGEAAQIAADKAMTLEIQLAGRASGAWMF